MNKIDYALSALFLLMFTASDIDRSGQSLNEPKVTEHYIEPMYIQQKKQDVNNLRNDIYKLIKEIQDAN